MKTITIRYPQIVIDTKEVSVEDEKFEELSNSSLHDITDFIWENLTEDERDWSTGKESMMNAIEVGYAGIRKNTKP
jgi:hypothetical protein